MKFLITLVSALTFISGASAEPVKPIDEIRDMLQVTRIRSECSTAVRQMRDGSLDVTLTSAGISRRFAISPSPIGQWSVERLVRSGVPYWMYAEKFVGEDSILSIQFEVNDDSQIAKKLDLIETDAAGIEIDQVSCGLENLVR